MKKLAGAALLGFVYGRVFAATVLYKGLVSALAIWGTALAVAALIYFVIWLLVDG